jgi:hypothetical protein
VKNQDKPGNLLPGFVMSGICGLIHGNNGQRPPSQGAPEGSFNYEDLNLIEITMKG